MKMKWLSVAAAVFAVGAAWAETHAVGDWTLTDGKGAVKLAYKGRTLLSNLTVGFWNPHYKGMRFAGNGAACVRNGDVVTFTKSNDAAAMKLVVAFAGKTARVTLDAELRQTPGPFEYGFVMPVASFNGPEGEPFARLGGAFFPIDHALKFESRGARTLSFDLPEAHFELANRGVGTFVLQDVRRNGEGDIRYIHHEDVDAPKSLHFEHVWTVEDDYDAATVAARRISFTTPLVKLTPVAVSNPGFEEGFVGWSAARNMSVDASVAHDGGKSARVTVADPMKDPVYLTRMIPVVGGAQYTAACFVKTENVREAPGRNSSVGAGLIVEWCDKKGKWMDAGQYACDMFGTKDWQRRKCDKLKAPLNAGYAMIYLTLRGTGTAWFDDLTFARIEVSLDKTAPLSGTTFANNCPHFTWRAHAGVRRYTVELSRDPAFGAGKVRSYDAGGFAEFQLTEPLEDGVWYWKVSAPGLEDRAPWMFTQTAPSSRDCLPPQIRTRACRVTRGNEPFAVRVVEDGAVHPTVMFGAVKGTLKRVLGDELEYVFTAPAGGWTKGLTETKLVAVDAAGNRAERPFWLLNAPKPTNEAVIDADGFFSENGRRIFPLGIYEVAPKYMLEVRRAGWDVVHTYRWESSQDDVACRAYLDRCWEAEGLRAFIGFDRGTGTGEGIVQGNFAHIARRVGALADHPALFCWYLFDEPEIIGQFVTPDLLTALADLVRVLDPYHAVVMTTWGPSMNEYRRTWDTHWTQAYGDPAGVVRQWEEHRRLLKNASPITMLVNCNDTKQGAARRRGEKPDPAKFSRDYDHLRACAFLGIVKECNGLWWWWFARDCTDFYTAAQVPQAWSDLVKVVKEIGALRPFVNAPGKVTTGTAVQGKKKVEWWAKTVGDKTMLIAVNTATESVDIEIDAPGLGKCAYSFHRHEVKVVRL